MSSGGFGVVYEAYHTKLENRLAIKTLHAGLSQNPMVVERFRREALATGKLQNPNAVKIFDRGTTEDGILWLAMEFVEGETLEDRLSRGPLSEAELLEWMEVVCEVLYEAHQKSIIHRDLKPQNIMLVPVGSGRLIPKVLDFGIAALRDTGDSLTNSGAVSGTPKYMAPEQWEGSKHTDHRADIYALGVLSYHCISGRLPFDADTPLAWMKQHCLKPPIALSVAMAGRTLSPAIEGAIMTALEKDPGARPQDAMSFFRMLSGKQPATVAPPEIKGSAPESSPTLPHVLSASPSPSGFAGIKRAAPLLGVGALLIGGLLWSSSRSPELPQSAATKPASQSTATQSASLQSTAPVSQPAATQPAQTTNPPTSAAAPALSSEEAACLKLINAQRLEDAIKSCAKLTNLSLKGDLEKLKGVFIARYSKQVEDAISNHKPADAALKKLMELSPSEPKLVELKVRYQESRKASLWAGLQGETGDPAAFCRLLDQYLALNEISPQESKAAATLLDKKGSPEEKACAPLFAKLLQE